jgi:hypothetical protein
MHGGFLRVKGAMLVVEAKRPRPLTIENAGLADRNHGWHFAGGDEKQRYVDQCQC